MTSLAKCFGWSQICWSGERVQNYIVFFLWFVELNAKNTHILDHIILQWLAVCLAQMPLSTTLPKRARQKYWKILPKLKKPLFSESQKSHHFYFLCDCHLFRLHSHAQDIREHYEKKLQRANDLYLELTSCLLQLEQREKDITK